MNKIGSLISGGWDPGTFSIERVLADAFIPGSNSYTFWGKGVSQGHSDAVRSEISGVIDARQYTIPIQEAIDSVRAGNNPMLKTRQRHTRLVYVVADKDADKERITREIKAMPDYFVDYDTTVEFITKEQMKEQHSAYPHGGFVITTGTTGNGNKASIEYNNQWESNPEATGNILVACARAVYRMRKDGKIGVITMLDVPPVLFSPRNREELIRSFM